MYRILISIFVLYFSILFASGQKNDEYSRSEVFFLYKELMYQNFLIKTYFKNSQKFTSIFSTNSLGDPVERLKYLKIKESCYINADNDSVIKYIHEKILILELTYVCDIEYGEFDKKAISNLTKIKDYLLDYKSSSKNIMNLNQEIINAIVIVLNNGESINEVENQDLQMIYKRVYENYVLKNPEPYIPN